MVPVARLFARHLIQILALLGAVAASPLFAQDVALSRAGQPDQWVVTGIDPGQRLALKKLPGTMFETTGTVRAGDVVENYGCTKILGRRWCLVEKKRGASAKGYLHDRYLSAENLRPDPGDGDSGGPDFWQVTGLKPGDTLRMRREPSAQSAVVASLRLGEPLRNLGCRTYGTARWCRVETIGAQRLRGYVNGRFLREGSGRPPRPPQPDDNLTAGPDFWRVTGLKPGDTLNVRQAPSAQSKILATLSPGERVRNLGCDQKGTTRWCLIRSTVGMDVTGYVSGRYLRE